MQVRGGGTESIDELRENFEFHERRAGTRPVMPKLNGAHLTAQIALTNRLDLDKAWQLHSIDPKRVFSLLAALTACAPGACRGNWQIPFRPTHDIFTRLVD
jgi:hypothetical protein